MPAPPLYVTSIAIDTVIEALGAFIQPFMPAGAQIVRGQGNRVAPPLSPFVLLTEISQTDLETPRSTDDPMDGQVNILAPTQIGIQVDFYGAAAGDYCKSVKGVFRSPYAPAQFPNQIKPLFCSDGHQGPLVTGEEQYETRWTLTANLHYNPSVNVPQQYADALSVAVLEDLP